MNDRLLEKLKNEYEVINPKKKRSQLRNYIIAGLVGLATLSLIGKKTYDNYVKTGNEVLNASTIQVEGGQIQSSDVWKHYNNELKNAGLRYTSDGWNQFMERMEEVNEGNIKFEFKYGYYFTLIKDPNKSIKWLDVHPDNRVGNEKYKTIDNKIN
jgi:hypothetical protein